MCNFQSYSAYTQSNILSISSLVTLIQIQNYFIPHFYYKRIKLIEKFLINLNYRYSEKKLCENFTVVRKKKLDINLNVRLFFLVFEMEKFSFGKNFDLNFVDNKFNFCGFCCMKKKFLKFE